VRSSASVGANPENSAAKAAMLVENELAMVIFVPLGMAVTACLAQMAVRRAVVVTCTSVAYVPLTGSEQVKVAAPLLLATNTRMLSPAVTAPVVLIVTELAFAVTWPRFCTNVMLASAGEAKTPLADAPSTAATGTILRRRHHQGPRVPRARKFTRTVLQPRRRTPRPVRAGPG
jgi:hypothetical protein